jgi:Tol biopolymer transport system component/predicted Ser/Thr protein kinase
MGEVYKAKDTRLDRIVAIKVLPEHLGKDPERRERFEREARTVSSLNHPHICTLHDIGRHDGIDFIVMEYIEGETLADRLARGALSLEQALRSGIQVADALEKAHRHGVVHRDLKPGNIMLAKSGVKILDFGLAKLQVRGTEVSGVSELPTKKKDLTREGAIVGTLQYMAPEQLEGKEADSRTDIFAFGAVFYEMVTGRKAFSGKSQASLITSIMSSEPPPPTKLDPLSPPSLDGAVMRCLEKEPDARWQSAGDLAWELARITEGGTQAQRPFLTSRRISLWGSAGIVVASMALGVMLGRGPFGLEEAVDRRVARFEIPLEGRLGDDRSVTLSPEGTHLVYAAGQRYPAGGRLYLRAMEQLHASPMPDTEGAQHPFFSPDGQWVGFHAGGALQKTSISGGAPVVLCEAPELSGASWSGDHIYFAERSRGISRVSAAGGTPELLIPLDEPDWAYGPELLPSGASVLFTQVRAGGSWNDAQVVVHVLGTGERKVLIEGGTDARYVSTGHIVYVRDGKLLAVPFDVDRIHVAAGPTSVVEGVLQSAGFMRGGGQFSFARTGLLAYAPGSFAVERMLLWVNRKGETIAPLFDEPIEDPRMIRLSPDRQRLALVAGPRGQADLWVYYLTGRPPILLTREAGNYYPVWSTDGSQIAFGSTRSGQLNLYVIPADGRTQDPIRLTTSENWQTPASWVPGEKAVLFSEEGDIFVLPLDGEAQPKAVVQTTESQERQPILSSDGRWLAYVSDRSGRDEVWIQRYPDGTPVRVSPSGGSEPVWGPGDRELLYRVGNKMMSVTFESGRELRPRAPVELFDEPFMHPGAPSYVVAPDGRFMMIETVAQEPAAFTRIHLVQNWFEELKRLVPTANQALQR